MSAELKEAIRKYALQNAALYGGKANPKAVMGKVLAEQPELRSRAKEVSAAAEEVCREVASMAFEDICKMAESIDPNLLKKTKCERKHVLPDLPGAEEGKVVMRMALDRPVRCIWATPGSPSSMTSTSRDTRASTLTVSRILTPIRSTPTHTR
jgi:hypothetical protein